jgi:hypothetical protein
MPGLVGHVHLDQHVTGIEAPLGNRPLASLDLDHFFGRNHDLAELGLQARPIDPLLQGLRHALFHPRIGVHDVPALRSAGLGRCFGLGCFRHHHLHHHFQRRRRSYRTNSRDLSTRNRKMAMITTKANTMPVVLIVSFRAGHVTRRVSS